MYAVPDFHRRIVVDVYSPTNRPEPRNCVEVIKPPRYREDGFYSRVYYDVTPASLARAIRFASTHR